METNPGPRGVKRPAEDDPRDDQRLTKRFNLLNLDQSSQKYVPVLAIDKRPDPSRNEDGDTARSNGANEAMQLDDTSDKVYVHSLDDELSEVEAADGMVFLPDIERRIGKIPNYLLESDLRPNTEKQLVLYKVPASLTVPEDQDNVRKAIIESRQRAWDKASLSTQEKHLEGGLGSKPLERLPSQSSYEWLKNHAKEAQLIGTHDEDAMDLG